MFILRGLLRLLVCLASGALLSLAYPPKDWNWLVWIALMPMLAALWTMKGRAMGWRGFLLGWAAGSAFFVINLAWLGTVADVGPYALGGFLGLYFAAFGAFTAKWGNPWRRKEAGWRSDLRFAFANAAFWTGLEWLRGWLLTGFGWNTLGVALHQSLLLIQGADLFSVLGLSFVILFVQLIVLMAARRLATGQVKIAVQSLAPAGVLLLLLTIYGAARLATVEQGDAIPLRALLVQANLPQEGPNPLLSPEETNMTYEAVTEAALDQLEGSDRFPHWVIWPESALAGRLFSADDGSWGMWEMNEETISRVRSHGNFSLIFGITEMESVPFDGQLVEKQDGRIWNSMVVMNPPDKLEKFRKRHLVIFGETIPFVDAIPWLRDIYEQQSGMEYGGAFSPGDSVDPLDAGIGAEKVGIIPSICFEDTVPRLERKFVRSGPQIIVNVTNDGWFKESEAAEQHFTNALFRAIELRRPMIRCANTGVSGIVSVAGRTQRLEDESGSHFTSGSLLARVDIPRKPPFSLYAIVGDWPVILLGLLGLGMGFRNRKNPPGPAEGEALRN